MACARRAGAGLDRQLVLSVRGGQAARAGLVAAAISTGQTVVTSDAYTHPWFNSAFDRDSGYRTKSVVVIPLKTTDGATIGAVQLINKHPYHAAGAVPGSKAAEKIVDFSAEDVLVAEALSTQIALTIEILQVKRQAENAVQLMMKEAGGKAPTAVPLPPSVGRGAASRPGRVRPAQAAQQR